MSFKLIFALVSALLLAVTLSAMEKPTLFEAVLNGDLPEVEKILASQMDNKKINEYLDAALFCAAEHGYTPIIARLLKNKDVADFINFRTSNGLTALHIACANGHHDVVELLVEKNAAINGSDYEGKNPLHHASSEGSLMTVELLLKKNACTNAVDKNGWTALHYAAGHKPPASIDKHDQYNEIVKLLLERGAFINYKDKNQSTPLHGAAEQGNTAIVKSLLERGAYYTYKNSSGKTAAELAKKDHPQIAELIDAEPKKRKEKMDEDEKRKKERQAKAEYSFNSLPTREKNSDVPILLLINENDLQK